MISVGVLFPTKYLAGVCFCFADLIFWPPFSEN